MHKNELPIPPIANADEKSVELVRVWASGGAQHVSLATNLWEDPGAWGIALVDMAKHLARAYQQKSGLPEDETLARIRAVFDAEWSSPTDAPMGGLLSKD